MLKTYKIIAFIIFFQAILSISQSIQTSFKTHKLKDENKLITCQGTLSKYIMCPKMYAPVCAVMKESTGQYKLKNEFKQYSNGCWACVDSEVYGWKLGKCLEQETIIKCTEDHKNIKELTEIEKINNINFCGIYKDRQKWENFDNIHQACQKEGVDYVIKDDCDNLVKPK